VLTAWFDVQKDRIEGEIIGWGAGEESWSIDYVRLYGNPLTDEVWNNLEKVIKDDYLDENGTPYQIAKVGIDCGYLADEVYKFCRAQGTRWVIPTKGHKDRARPVQEYPRKPDQRTRVYRTMVGTDTAKTIIYNRFESTLIAEEPGGPGYCHHPIKEGYDETYFEQATAEEKIKKYSHGVAYYEWDAKKRRNEVLDAKVGNLVMIRILQAHFGVKLLGIVKPTHRPPPKPPNPPQQRQQSRFNRRSL
jgi:phage terminase large subunit GpA-like protein